MGYVEELREFEKDGFIYRIKHIRDHRSEPHFGEFSDKWQEGAIEQIDDPRGYRYFIPTSPDTAQEDYERLLAYRRGDWLLIAIVVDISLKEKNYLVAHSDGAWGVPSDSNTSYLAELEEEQIAEAEAELSGIKEGLCRV